MRIAVIASPVTVLQPAQLGGAQAMVTDLATGLAGRGHDVRLHCAEGSVVEGVELVTVPAPADAAGALVMPGGRAPLPAPGVSAAIDAMFEAAARGGAEVISQHAFDAEAFRDRAGPPVLHTLHLPPVVPEVVEAAARVPASRLATVSQASARTWRRAGVAVGRVLANGVPDMEFDAGASVDRCALIAGRISPEKGIETALAASRRAGLPLRVAGPLYDPDYRVALEGAEPVGHLTRAELRRLMARSAVTVCAPRWEEPFALVAAEAQMAGCPVAAFARGGLTEVIEEGVSGRLARADDVEALASAIVSCLALDRRLVRASALRRLTLDAALDRYERALEEVAASARRS